MFKDCVPYDRCAHPLVTIISFPASPKAILNESLGKVGQEEVLASLQFLRPY